MPERFPTTVVIPLYGDLPSAKRSVRSVLEHVDLDFHRLLVVNDVGPEADRIEAAILAILDDAPGTTYIRNPRNLGFVGTCNRAATEIDTTSNDILLLNSDAAVSAGTVDEMSRVLHLSEKHGVVTSRSNYATIATIPGRTRSGARPTPERSREVFDALRSELPPYTVVPVAHGFCFLVRRSLVRNFGLFDLAFAPGYGEENEFCLRVNARGFSSVMANRAYTHHEGEKSFSSLTQQEIKDSHEALLIERYPFYPSALRHYDEDGVDAADWFADYLVPSDADRSVLIDLHHMSLIYDGTVRNALTFLTFLQKKRDAGELAGIEFTIASSPDAIEFFQLHRFGFRVLPNHQVTDLFDLGFSLAPLSAPGQIKRFDRLCVRWVASHLDIIALRIIALWETDYTRAQIVVDALTYSDRVVAISHATVADTIDRFPDLGEVLSERTTVIHQGVADAQLTETADAFDHHSALSPTQTEAVNAKDYVLVVGNTFLHKQVEAAVAVLGNGSRTVVAFGGISHDGRSSVVPVQGGLLTDDDVAALYDNAAVVVYPSVYEGFGLPIAEAALHGKPVVLFETAVAHEVADILQLGATAHYFSEFTALPEAVEAAVATAPDIGSVSVRSIGTYNQGILDVICEVLDEPVSITRLRARRAYFRSVRAYEEGQRQRILDLERELARAPLRLASAIAHRLRALRPAAAVARRMVRRIRNIRGTI